MIMKTSGSGQLPPVSAPLAHTAPGSTAARPQTVEGQYDQVRISRTPSEESRFHQELVSRLVRETRTANTTGEIQRIKQEVRSGTYRIDPAEIAGKLLLEGKVCGRA